MKTQDLKRQSIKPAPCRGCPHGLTESTLLAEVVRNPDGSEELHLRHSCGTVYVSPVSLTVPGKYRLDFMTEPEPEPEPEPESEIETTGSESVEIGTEDFYETKTG